MTPDGANSRSGNTSLLYGQIPVALKPLTAVSVFADGISALPKSPPSWNYVTTLPGLFFSHLLFS